MQCILMKYTKDKPLPQTDYLLMGCFVWHSIRTWHQFKNVLGNRGLESKRKVNLCSNLDIIPVQNARQVWPLSQTN